MSDDYSDTPRTNKLMNSIPFEQIARQFERELAAVTRERDAAVFAMKMATEERDAARYGCDRLGAELAAAHAESEALQPGIDHLRETCDALERERDEDQGVIAVWRGRTQRAEEKRDALGAEVEWLRELLAEVARQCLRNGGIADQLLSAIDAALTPAEEPKT